MMKSLKKCGAADAVFKKYNSLSVNVSKLDCDYYRFKELDKVPLIPTTANIWRSIIGQTLCLMTTIMMRITK